MEILSKLIEIQPKLMAIRPNLMEIQSKPREVLSKLMEIQPKPIEILSKQPSQTKGNANKTKRNPSSIYEIHRFSKPMVHHQPGQQPQNGPSHVYHYTQTMRQP